MKITELLRLIDEDAGMQHHSFRIYRDGSGYILDPYDKELYEFNDEAAMKKTLNEIYFKLKKDNINWEL